jgi:predicted 3-demethylubiquinone-9 3-methyltransferase (glyoxalase superfamily)
MSAGPLFKFYESISFQVYCETQVEIDCYWKNLAALPDAEQCGWLKDKYGLSWQVVPAVLIEMMQSGYAKKIARVNQAFLKMKKFDIAALQRAYDGE